MGPHHTDIVEVAGKVMVVGIILLFFVVVFFCCLHLYFKWFYRQHEIPDIRRRRRRMDFAGGHQEMVFVSSESGSIGLEACVLKSIPIVTVMDGGGGGVDEEEMECAVCLCGVREGEKARILPRCNHGFHVDCIDMWFHSHATCPLCRNPISVSIQHLPTTTDLLTCSEAEAATSSPAAPAPAVVIDIPLTHS